MFKKSILPLLMALLLTLPLTAHAVELSTLSGNIGINTVAPQAKLQVVGNVMADGFQTGNAGAGQVSTTNGFSLDPNHLDFTTARFLCATTGYCGFGSSLSSPNSVLTIQDSTTLLFRVIGTSTSSASTGGGAQFNSDDGAANGIGDRGGFLFLGGVTDGAHTYASGASLQQFMTQDWTATHNGAELGIYTKPTDSTTSTLRMIIGSAGTGNVGIGTYSPTALFQVKGLTQTDSFKMATGASNNYVLTSDTNGVGTWAAAAAGGGTAAGGTNAIQYNSGSSTFAGDETKFSINSSGNVGVGTTNATSANLSIVKSGSGKPFAISSAAGLGGDYLSVSNNGNVGVGTANAQAPLTVGSTGQFQVSAAGAVTAASFVGDGSGLTGISSAGGGWIDGGTNMYQSATTDTVGIGTTTPLSTLDVKGSLAAGTYAGTVAAPSNGFIISGNVGIGTSVAASRALHVAASSTNLYTTTLANTTTAAISIANTETSSTTAAFPALQFQARNSSNTLVTEAWIAGVSGSHSAGSESMNLAFGTRTSGTNAEAFRIQGGAVGIGTTQLSNKAAIWGALTVGADSTTTNTTGPTNGMLVKGNVGIGTLAPGQALDVAGIIQQSNQKSCSTGLTTDAAGAINGCVASDEKLKKNIRPIEYDPAFLQGLHPVFYEWKDSSTKDAAQHAGFIAQQVEEVFPPAVVNAGIDIKGVDADAILAIVVLEVKFLSGRVKVLTAIILMLSVVLFGLIYRITKK